MKIYVAENYHDNDCGVFSDRDLALAHLDSHRGCCINEYELESGKFEHTGESVEWVACQNCGSKWRDDTAPVIRASGVEFCSEVCQKENDEFYNNGGVGIYGKTTREMKQHIIESMAAGKDPMQGCAGFHNKELTWCPVKIDA